MNKQNDVNVNLDQESPTNLSVDQASAGLSESGKGKTSKMKRFERTVLIWITVIAVSFLTGFLTYHYVRYVPLKTTLETTTSELSQARTELDNSQKQIFSLKSDLTAAGEKVKTLESENADLGVQLENSRTRAGLLQVLADVNNARLALTAEDVPTAKSALKDTHTRLEELGPAIEKVDANLAKSIPQRLELVVFEMDTDSQTASTDLTLLGSSLQNVLDLMK